MISETYEDHEVVEKAIEVNNGQTGGSVNTILTKKQRDDPQYSSEDATEELKKKTEFVGISQKQEK